MKLAKTANCVYLYADGHAVVIHEERHAKAGPIEWAEVFEKLDVHCNFDGRIVFHHPRYDRVAQMAMEGYSVRASSPSVSNGSDRTKQLGIEVGTLEIEFKDGRNLSWSLMPNILSNGITYQPEIAEKPCTPNDMYFGVTRIAKFHPAKSSEAEPKLAIA